MIVDVELGDRHRTLLLDGDLLENGGDHLARSAPLGPEVDDDGAGGGPDRFVERGGREGLDAVCHREWILSRW